MLISKSWDRKGEKFNRRVSSCKVQLNKGMKTGTLKTFKNTNKKKNLSLNTTHWIQHKTKTLDQPGFDSLEIELEQMGEAERKDFCKRALHNEWFNWNGVDFTAWVVILVMMHVPDISNVSYVVCSRLQTHFKYLHRIIGKCTFCGPKLAPNILCNLFRPSWWYQIKETR